jgi:hypothetical protein
MSGVGTVGRWDATGVPSLPNQAAAGGNWPSSVRHRRDKHEGDNTVLTLYLQEVSRNQPLSKGDEEDLLHRGRGGDPTALRKVIESYLAQTAEIAIETAPPGMDRLEAIQHANTVLISLVADSSVAYPSQVLEDAVRDSWDID